MEYQQNNKNQLMKQNKTLAQDKERVLMEYAGIFKNNVKEYAEKYLTKVNRKRKNYSR